MPAGVGYVSGDSSSAMKDGPGTIVVTVLVLLLWLFSVYRLYRVWAVKLNFSAPGVNNFYCSSLHFLWESSSSVSNNTTQCSRGFFVLINSINCIVLALITMIIGSLFVVLYKMDFPLKVHESHRGWDFLYHWMQNKWTRHHNQTKLQQDEEANNTL